MPEDYFDEGDHRELRFGDLHRERWRDLENIEAGTPAEKRRHHYVPQMWLRNWADPATKQVEVFDIDNENNFKSKPASILFVKNLYTTGTETSPGYDMGPEEAFSQIEGAGATAMKAVLNGEDLSEGQRYDLALLIALQHLRGPEVVATAVPDDILGLKDGLEAAAATLLAAPDGPPPPQFADHAYGRSSHEIAAFLLDGFDEFDALERGFGFWNLLEAVHHLAGRMFRRQWTILTTKSVLVISDDPVYAKPLGGTTFKAKGVVGVYDTPIPIGPHTLLLIGNRPDGEGLAPAQETELYAAVSNEIQVNKAKRFLIGPPTSPT